MKTIKVNEELIDICKELVASGHPTEDSKETLAKARKLIKKAEEINLAQGFADELIKHIGNLLKSDYVASIGKSLVDSLRNRLTKVIDNK